MIVGNFNTPLSKMDRTTKHMMNKETEDFKGIINQ